MLYYVLLLSLRVKCYSKVIYGKISYTRDAGHRQHDNSYNR